MKYPGESFSDFTDILFEQRLCAACRSPSEQGFKEKGCRLPPE
jgi:hypothetical protein